MRPGPEPPQERVLWVIRHAPPAQQGVCYGWHDIPCLAAPSDPWRLFVHAGIEADLGRLDDAPPALWSSDSLRCQELAAPLGDALGATPRLTGNLRELYFGAFEGRTWDEIHARTPDALAAWGADPWRTPPSLGETPGALMARVNTFCRALEAGVHLVVTHATVVRALRALAEGTDLAAQASIPVPHLAPERLILVP